MCGMNWYREQMARAEEDIDRLSELLRMMEDRYKLALTAADGAGKLNPDIIAVYQEITARKKTLLPAKTPQD